MRRLRTIYAKSLLTTSSHKWVRAAFRGLIADPLAEISKTAGIEFPRKPSDSTFASVLMMASYLAGFHEREVIRTYSQILKPGMIAVDVGAHGGYHTVRFSKLVEPHGRVIAFEPSRDSFAALVRNVNRKGISNVRTEQAAIWNQRGMIELFSGATSAGNSVVIPRAESHRVRSISLDEYFEGNKIGTPNLVKIDVEGAEVAVLEGMEGLIKSSPGITVIIEFFPKVLVAGGFEPHQLLDDLKQLGFKVYEIRPSGKPLQIDRFGDSTNFAEEVSKRVRKIGEAPMVNLLCARD